MTSEFGRIIVNTQPAGAYVYLDGEPVLDSLGQVAKTPTVVLNAIEGYHYITFRRFGYNDTTITVDVPKGSYSQARAVLDTSRIRYPMMLSQ